MSPERERQIHRAVSAVINADWRPSDLFDYHVDAVGAHVRQRLLLERLPNGARELIRQRLQQRAERAQRRARADWNAELVSSAERLRRRKMRTIRALHGAQSDAARTWDRGSRLRMVSIGEIVNLCERSPVGGERADVWELHVRLVHMTNTKLRALKLCVRMQETLLRQHSGRGIGTPILVYAEEWHGPGPTLVYRLWCVHEPVHFTDVPWERTHCYDPAKPDALPEWREWLEGHEAQCRAWRQALEEDPRVSQRIKSGDELGARRLAERRGLVWVPQNGGTT